MRRTERSALGQQSDLGTSGDPHGLDIRSSAADTLRRLTMSNPEKLSLTSNPTTPLAIAWATEKKCVPVIHSDAVDVLLGNVGPVEEQKYVFADDARLVVA